MQTNHKIATELSLSGLLEEGYRYIWIQEMDHVELKPLSEVELCLDRMIEARVFSEKKEIHLFQMEDMWRAIETVREDQDDCFEEVQLLRTKYGKKIILRHYVGYDDDGQAYIKRSVIAGYEE